MQTLYPTEVLWMKLQTEVPCVYACKKITKKEHVNDTIVHIRFQLIMETLKHPACTVCQLARLCRSWLSKGIATRICHGGNPYGPKQLLKTNCKHLCIVAESLVIKKLKNKTKQNKKTCQVSGKTKTFANKPELQEKT